MTGDRPFTDFLGDVEPHAPMLNQPPADQLLYKVMRTEDFIASLEGAYLHFNRVDSYRDFPGADPRGGRQLPLDVPGNAATRFEKAPDFTAENYHDQCRSRT